jgi:uncharacterized SAM-binding protein YcdF (DUF218 family)
LNNTQYQAVIVLANLMDRQGNLNAETRARVERAAQAVEEGVAPLLVLCGWAYRHDSDICIADAMKRYAIEELEIAGSAIITEPASRDTVGDAVFTKRNLAAPLCWTRVLLVTSDYHLPRALAIFSFVYGPGITVDGLAAASADGERFGESETQSMDAFRNTFEGINAGDDLAIFERLQTRHPFYNGDTYPRIGP